MKYVKKNGLCPNNKKLDVERYRLKNANPSEEIERVEAELVEFQSRNIQLIKIYDISVDL